MGDDIREYGRDTGRDGPDFPDASLSDVCRAVLHGQSTAVSILDSAFNPLYINPAYERLFGVSFEEWRRRPMTRHFGPDAATLVAETILPALASENRWEGALEIKTPEGEAGSVMAEIKRIPDERGRPGHCFGTYVDISRLKALERSLHLQVDFLNNILDTVPDPIFVKDEQHGWVVANKAYCEFIGRDREQVIGRNDRDYFPREEADVFWEKDDEVFASGEENINEEYFTDKRGVRRMISTKKAAFTQDDGQRVLVGVFRNITEDRRLMKTLANSYYQLEAAFYDLQARLLGVQAHITTEVTRTGAIKDILNRSNEELEQLAGRIGQGMAAPKGPGPAGPRPHMSRREHQVFILLAEGVKIKDAAARLGLSPNTVSTYRSRIMKKLGVSSTAELIQYALRSGLA